MNLVKFNVGEKPYATLFERYSTSSVAMCRFLLTLLFGMTEAGKPGFYEQLSFTFRFFKESFISLGGYSITKAFNVFKQVEVVTLRLGDSGTVY